MDSKAEIRQTLLTQRQALDAQRRQCMDGQICAHLLRYFQTRQGLRIAGYAAHRGEPDILPALEALHQAGYLIYLPVTDSEAMRFARWTPTGRMRRGAFGISEPAHGQTCPAAELDVVLCPLVAYSPSGARLGMGGGYYDRCFAFARGGRGPRLLGVAYGLQAVDGLPAEPWDVPLAGVVTERGTRIFEQCSTG